MDVISGGCPLCGGDRAVRAFDAYDRNRGISDEWFRYLRCEACQTLYVDPVPSDLDKYYPSSYYAPPAPGDVARRAVAERPKLDLLLRHSQPPGQLVEIGPGDGLFAWLAQQAGYQVTGIEMDPRMCEHLERDVGIHAVCSGAPEEVLAQGPPLRTVVLWHSFEHLPHPGRVLEAAAQRLEPGGVLLIASPNPEAMTFKLLGHRWAHVDAPRHLTLVPIDALATQARRVGLRLANVVLDDPGGRHWNRFAWERAIRRKPSAGPPTRLTSFLGAAMAKALSPIESRGRRGSAYTATLIKAT